jgi:hypothetical protein
VRHLVAQRHLLADDEEAAIRRAGEHWDTATTEVDRTAV